jgi:GTP cyclohydrolase II
MQFFPIFNKLSSCKFASESKLPTKFGEFTISTFEEPCGKDHIALTIGDIQDEDTVMCRVHSECLTGDALHSLRCDCGPQLQAALKMLAQNKTGILLYLRQEGRGIGLVNKIRAYALQDQGHDTVEANEMLGFPADLREYNICLDILQHFEISSVNLLTNNPKKVSALEEVGITVVKRTSLHEGANEKNQDYLNTKRDKMGHLR